MSRGPETVRCRAAQGALLGAVRRPALLINPRAGTHVADRRGMARLARGFSSLGAVAECSCPATLRQRLTEWRATGVDLLVLSGGDGTLHLALREIIASWGTTPLPALLFLHGGTTGDVAASLGSQSPDRVVEWLGARLDRDGRLPMRPICPLEVEGSPAFNCGLGWFAHLPALAARVLDSGAASARNVHAAGPGGWLRKGPWLGTVEVDGSPLEGAWGGLLALSVEHVLCRPLAAPATDAGTFSLLLARNGWSGLAGFTRRWLLGATAGVGEAAPSMRASRIDLRADEPGWYMADGEYYELPSLLRIRSGPRLLVVLPPSAGKTGAQPVASWVNRARRSILADGECRSNAVR